MPPFFLTNSFCWPPSSFPPLLVLWQTPLAGATAEQSTSTNTGPVARQVRASISLRLYVSSSTALTWIRALRISSQPDATALCSRCILRLSLAAKAFPHHPETEGGVGGRVLHPWCTEATCVQILQWAHHDGMHTQRDSGCTDGTAIVWTMTLLVSTANSAAGPLPLALDKWVQDKWDLKFYQVCARW